MARRTRVPAAPLATLVAITACGSAHPSTCAGEAAGDCRVDTVTVDGHERTYVLSHRAALDCSAGKVPVVFAWHGNSDNGEGLRSYLGLEAGLSRPALVVYPDGLGRSDTNGNSGWNRDPQGDDVRFFDGMLDRLAQDDCLDTTRVFSVGHSRGGRFVEVLACFRASRHRAFGSISAGTGNVSDCPGAAPIWLTHGVKDQTISFSEGETNRDHWAARDGCESPSGSFTLDSCTELRGCAAATPVVWCPSTVTEWGGHAPPAFAPAELDRFFARFW